ncbi:MAG TPA: oligosaccharide flippase family protein [Myxococcota bacterium]|nr:oligosaccharide flippase family protein [Myxococcota bacterium]
MGFFRNVAFVLATSAAALPISLATGVVLARWLSVADRGLYALLTTFSAIVFLLTQLGWGDAIIYRTRRHSVSPRKAFATGLIANGAFALAAFALCLVFREPLSRGFLGDVSPRAFWIAAATAPLLTIGDLLRGVARALDRFDLHNQFGLLQSGLILVALVIALPLAGGALEAALVANLLVQAALVASFGARVAALAGFEWRVDLPEALASIAYGGVMYLQNLLVNLHERVDVFLLAALGVAASDIGVYAAAVSVVAPLRLIPGALGTVLLPRLAGASESDAAAFTAAVVRPSILLMLIAALALAGAGALGIPLLFGRDYAPAVVPFLVLLPGVTAVTVSRVLARYFAAVGRQRALVVLLAAALLLNVALNYVLIPRAGIVGAALASLISYSLEAAAMTALFVVDSGEGLRATLVPRASDFEAYAARLREIISARAR